MFFFLSLGRNWTKQQQPAKLMLLKGVIPCVNSLRSISGVFKLIHLSVSFSSNYTSVKCHLSRLSLTRVMSSSQPLRQPKWSLHCFEPAGSRCGMEEWAGSPQCDWEAKLTVSFREEVEGGVDGICPDLFSCFASYFSEQEWHPGGFLFATPSLETHPGWFKSLPRATAFICMHDLSSDCEDGCA